MQIRAIVESISIHPCDACGDRNGGKAGAAVEGIRLNAHDLAIHDHAVLTASDQHLVFGTDEAVAGAVVCRVAVLHSDLLKASAVAEGLMADRRHTLANGQRHKVRAVCEGILADLGHGVGNDQRRKARRLECIIANARHTCGNAHRCQSIATDEHAVRNLRHTFGQSYGRKIRAIAEHIASHVRHSGGDGDLRQLIATGKCLVTDARHIDGNGDTLQTIAGEECQLADARYAVGDRNVLQVVAIAESIIPNAHHAFGKGDVLEIGAITECIITNADHAVGNDDGRQTRAMIECLLANRHDRVGEDDRIHALPLKCPLANTRDYFVVVGRGDHHDRLVPAIIPADVAGAVAVGGELQQILRSIILHGYVCVEQECHRACIVFIIPLDLHDVGAVRLQLIDHTNVVAVAAVQIGSQQVSVLIVQHRLHVIVHIRGKEPEAVLLGLDRVFGGLTLTDVVCEGHVIGDLLREGGIRKGDGVVKTAVATVRNKDKAD